MVKTATQQQPSLFDLPDLYELEPAPAYSHDFASQFDGHPIRSEAYRVRKNGKLLEGYISQSLTGNCYTYLSWQCEVPGSGGGSGGFDCMHAIHRLEEHIAYAEHMRFIHKLQTTFFHYADAYTRALKQNRDRSPEDAARAAAELDPEHGFLMQGPRQALWERYVPEFQADPEAMRRQFRDALAAEAAMEAMQDAADENES